MKHSNLFFIAGTDTDAGKTVVTAALLRGCARCNRRVSGLKPVQTGCTRNGQGVLIAPDVTVYEEACPQGQHRALMSFEPACSPHLAAQQAGMQITAETLAHRIAKSASTAPPHSVILVEGSGGIMVPLNSRETLLDLIVRLGIPVLLVIPNKLGAINHALLSMRALQTHHVNTIGFVLTAPGAQGVSQLDQTIADDNCQIIEKLSGHPCLGVLPWLPNLKSCDALERQQAWEKAALALKPAVAAMLNEARGHHATELSS